MEASWVYGTTNIIIVSLFYIGLAFAIAWMLHKKTRVFGTILAIALLLLTQVHANILYYLTFHSLAYGYNTISLFLALVLTAFLLLMQYQQLRKASVAIVDKQFGMYLGKGAFVAVGFTIALSLLDMVF
jgi:hypothetical protein